MKGDFSRDTFHAAKRFSRVLRQQGRVQLDADPNEQTAILLHYLRTLAVDLIGPSAGPKGSLGFELKIAEDDLTVGEGRYYVNGILCENFNGGLRYTEQPDFPSPPPLADGTWLAFLDVWERHITPLEDDSIREKALGGPDTATRAKVVWQVRIDDGKPLPGQTETRTLPLGNPSDVKAPGKWTNWEARWQPVQRGSLKAKVQSFEDPGDPCLTAPDSKYRGQENQLYRVEIHQSGAAGSATFKWSRDNGSVATGVEASAGTELTVAQPRGFYAGSWVELSNDGQELRGEPGTLVRLVKIEGDLFTLESTPSPLSPLPGGEVWPTKARRWDHPKNGVEKSGAPPVKEAQPLGGGDWIDLENGIQIQFQPAPSPAVHAYRTGDYWLIPARVATGNIEWPTQTGAAQGPAALEPFGVRHHYAPLAIVTLGGASPTIKDCRTEIKT